MARERKGSRQAGTDQGTRSQVGRQRLVGPERPGRAVSSRGRRHIPGYTWTHARSRAPSAHREPPEIPQLFQVPSRQLGRFQIGPRSGRLTPDPEHSAQPSLRGYFGRSLHALACQSWWSS